MVRKRKAGGGGATRHTRLQHQQDDDLDGGRYKMNVQNYMDVADDEDEWDLQRDKILLEDDGPARKRQRRRDEEADALEDSAEEVLSVPSDPEMDEEDYEDEEIQAESDGNFAAQTTGTEGRKQRRVSGESDEKEEDQEADARQRRRPEDEEGWGNDDAYGADVAENEDDAKEIEAEALRLQKKRLEGLTDADFGFDEAEWLGRDGEEGGEDTVEVHGDGAVTELLLLTNISEDTSVEERQRILRLRYPEFEPLANEFRSMQQLVNEIRPKADKSLRVLRERHRRTKMDQGHDEPLLPAAVLKYNSLAAYTATLAMYFALLASPGSETKGGAKLLPMDPKELREHSIMDSLIRQRKLWERVRDISDSEYESDGHDTDTSELADSNEISVYYTPKEDAFGDRLPEAMREAPAPPRNTKKISKKMQAALDAQAAEQARRDAYLKKLDKDMAKLDESTALPSSRKTAKPPAVAAGSAKPQGMSGNGSAGDSDSEFGDEVPLTVDEALAKEKRRKSLRFYTSQIAQKANKRSRMGQDQGGDTDIPYRERDKDRVARLNAEAEARGRKNKSAAAPRSDELGGDSDDDDRAAAAALRGAVDADSEGEDYYQTIASRKTAKKADKDARKAALREAALRGAQLHEVERVGPDGKRAIGYTIEKNKGLTQNRRKDVRNPRVKKRMKFENKKKKLASMRQVYKGGEGRGGYGGELTGIKKGLVRSVKL